MRCRSLSIHGRQDLALLLCVLLGFGLGLSACSSISSNSPPLPDSTFSRVMVELQLLNARADQESSLPPGIRDSVLTHYGIDRRDFEATLRYYSRRPAEFEQLYQGVLDSLKALKRRRPYQNPQNQQSNRSSPDSR